jgi:hypothetical protein
MPYYDRFERLMRSIYLLEKWYYGEDVEVVICKDGGGPMYFETILDARIVDIHREPGPLNPCTAINKAVEVSSGELVVITSPEIMHDEPALMDLEQQFFAAGERVNYIDKIYMAAPCFDPDRGWLAGPETPHGEGGRAPVPEGAEFPFLAMLTRQLFDDVGGYDEDYRHGQGYDDNDFLWRLDAAGVTFLTSDVPVRHEHVPLKWNLPSNKDLFYEKWPQCKS